MVESGVIALNHVGAADPGAVAQDMGPAVGYLPGLSMRRIADLTPGNAKTDARDAAVIAQAARTMPHTPCGRSPPAMRTRQPWRC